MSFHDAASEVSALNRGALQQPLRVDARTWTVLSAAQRLSRLSEGAFDICKSARRLRDWGYLPEGCQGVTAFEGRPDRYRAAARRPRAGFHRPLLIDLGGIAKGYAVDCAIAVLCQAGVEAALVNAGGDLRGFGCAVANRSHLRHPLSPAVTACIAWSLCDEALATSANTWSRRDARGGREVSPLLDPAQPAGPGSAQMPAGQRVRAADCMSADALTKVVLFAAPDVTERVLATYGAQAYVQQPAAAAA